MNDDEPFGHDTAAVADARETVDLVFSVALALAMRAVEHVEEHGVGLVRLDDEPTVGEGLKWSLWSTYSAGSSFVTVSGRPMPTEQKHVVSQEEYAQLLSNDRAAFSLSVPRAWIELASKAAQKL